MVAVIVPHTADNISLLGIKLVTFYSATATGRSPRAAAAESGRAQTNVKRYVSNAAVQRQLSALGNTGVSQVLTLTAKAPKQLSATDSLAAPAVNVSALATQLGRGSPAPAAEIGDACLATQLAHRRGAL